MNYKSTTFAAMFKIRIVVVLLLFAQLPLRAQYDLNHFYYRGRQSLYDGKYSLAIENFNILARLDSTYYEAYFFRGIAKYNLGDFTGAKKDFDRTVHFNPVYTPAYHYRAITSSRLGRYEEALRDLAEAVDLRPSYTGLYFSRGVTYFLSGQFDKAIVDFDRFLRKEPDAADAFLNRGASYLFMGDTLKALDDYGKAITLDRYNPEGYVRRSRVYAMQSRYDSALEDLNTALRLDTTNTFAYFNRAIVKYNDGQLAGALEDLNRVLKDEPGNALTLYNRALILSQVGDTRGALDDYDRVLNINPNNVLAYFNRASVFMEMGRYDDAIDDYSKAIELYPDFAKAYMNRAYARSCTGRMRESKADYDTAQKKIAEYRAATSDSTGYAAFADTSKQYSSLLALDAEFAKKDFDDELLQYRDVDINLKPLYKFVADEGSAGETALSRKFNDAELERFLDGSPLKLRFASVSGSEKVTERSAKDIPSDRTPDGLFARAVIETLLRQYNTAMVHYDEAIDKDPGNKFFYINRGALQAEMIDFISSMENNVQILTLDNTNSVRTIVNDRIRHDYDYSQALDDMQKASDIDPSFPYTQYNLGNLYCLSGDLPEAISRYSRSIELYPYIGEAYYNRGLVQIYLKDREKGCLDLSVAGELGIEDAYSVIKKYCKSDDE